MNYLAHFHLAHRTDTSYTGGLLGDFVKGNDYRAYPEAIQIGIVLHRLVDRYTDEHPLFKASQALLERTPKRVSGIAVDMLFDHLLARDWQQFHAKPLDEFVQQVYREFDVDRRLMPERAAKVSLAMGHGDWLSTYTTEEGLRRALQGISHRLHNRFDLPAAVDDLSEHQLQLTQHFHTFYGDLLQQLPNMMTRAMQRVG